MKEGAQAFRLPQTGSRHGSAQFILWGVIVGSPGTIPTAKVGSTGQLAQAQVSAEMLEALSLRQGAPQPHCVIAFVLTL